MTGVIDLIFQVGPAVLTLAIGYLFGLTKLKDKIHQLSEFFVAVDTAIYDNNITEAEFRDIFEKGRQFFTGGFLVLKKGKR